MNTDAKKTVIVAMTIIVMIVAIIGASYAYLAASIGSAATTTLNVKTSNVDNLVFIAGNDIIVTANQDNFGSGSGDRTGSATVQAKLTANSYSAADQYYRAYLVISDNNFVYTSGTTPELTLTVTRGGTTVVSNMDITTKTGVIVIPNTSGATTTKQTIHANAGATTTETWTATVTFVNLNSNQNANTGKTFKARIYLEGAPLLPSEYQEVNYITASGTQYINPNYVPSSSTKIKTMVSTTSASNISVYGNATGLTGGVRCFQSGGKLYAAFGDYRAENTAVMVNNVIYLTEHSPSSLLINNKSYTSSGGTEFDNIWFLKDAYSTSYKFIGDVYRLQIFEGATLVRDLVPCYRISDNVVGVYDTVGKTFYTNAGSGSFTKGANAN
jgi:hypothetical protein